MKTQFLPRETERLILREIEEQDAKRIVNWRSNPDAYKYFLNPHKLTLAEHYNWYENSYKANENRIDIIFETINNAEEIGVGGIVKREDHIVEINYLIDPLYLRKGYATEAIDGMCTLSELLWKAKKIHAEVHQNNLASINLVNKMGFSIQTKNKDFYILEKVLHH